MTKALLVSCAAAFLAVPGSSPAIAQDAADGDSVKADLLTMECGSLNALDAETSAGIIYYIAGYSDGQRVALAASGPASTETGSGEGGATENPSDNAAEQTATDASTNPEEGTTSAGAGGETTADGSPQGAHGPAASLGISIEGILAACADAPDSPASEVIKVARGALQPEVDTQDEDPATEGEEGQDVGSGNTVVE